MDAGAFLKPVEKRLIIPEEVEKIAKMRVFYLLADLNESFAHLVNILFRRWEIV